MGYNPQQYYLPDSGAMKWMTPFYNDFKPDSVENIPEVYVRVGDGHRISVTKAGTLEVCFSNHINMQEQTTITITGVLYVPEITH